VVVVVVVADREAVDEHGQGHVEPARPGRGLVTVGVAVTGVHERQGRPVDRAVDEERGHGGGEGHPGGRPGPARQGALGDRRGEEPGRGDRERPPAEGALEAGRREEEQQRQPADGGEDEPVEPGAQGGAALEECAQERPREEHRDRRTERDERSHPKRVAGPRGRVPGPVRRRIHLFDWAPVGPCPRRVGNHRRVSGDFQGKARAVAP